MYEAGSEVLIKTHIFSRASDKFTNQFSPKRDGHYLIVYVSYITPFIEKESDVNPVVPR